MLPVSTVWKIEWPADIRSTPRAAALSCFRNVRYDYVQYRLNSCKHPKDPIGLGSKGAVVGGCSCAGLIVTFSGEGQVEQAIKCAPTE